MKILTWNMAGAGFHTATPHSAAWDWLRGEATFDIALLQEAIPPSDLSDQFATVLFRPRVTTGPRVWGNCILARDAHYQEESAEVGPHWADRALPSFQLARSQDNLPWLVNVHSSSEPMSRFPRESFVNDGGLTCHRSRVWEIEVAAHLVRQRVTAGRYLLGGDLNSALLLDKVRKHRNNERLWANLAVQGFFDLRPNHYQHEQQTFFRPNTNPYQLDHFFGDTTTRSATRSWSVLTEIARDRQLSDHAPVAIEVEYRSVGSNASD